MNRETRLSVAIELMREFTELTGLSPSGEEPGRYLWTDVFLDMHAIRCIYSFPTRVSLVGAK